MSGIFAMASVSSFGRVEEAASVLAEKMVFYAWQSPQVITIPDAKIALGAVIHDNPCLDQTGYCRQEGPVCCVIEGFLIRSLSDCGVGPDIQAGRYAQAAIAAYRKFGSAFIEKLEGSFAVLLHDAEKGLLIAGNGRFANTPLYWYSREGESLYCTQLGPMAGCRFFDAQADPLAVGTLLSDGALSWTDSLLRDVKTLEVASIVEHSLQSGNRKDRIYWSFGNGGRHETEKPFRQHVGELCEVLTAAGRRITSRPGRYISGLSGGLDSRLVTSVAAGAKPELKSWTFGASDSPDMTIAARISQALGIEHLTFPTRPELVSEFASEFAQTVDGSISIEMAGGLERKRLLMKDGDIVLNGFAGEVILGNYLLGLNLKLLLTNLKKRRIPGGTIPHPLLTKNRTLDSIAGYMAFKAGPPSCLAPYLTHRPRPVLDRFREQLQAYSSYVPTPYLPIHLILMNRGSRWTLMGSISDRHFHSDGSLFYDYEVLDRCMTIPQAYRQGNQVYSAVFKTLFPEIGAIPNSNTGERADVGPRRALVGRMARGLRSKLFPEKVGNKATGMSPNDWSRKIYPDLFRDLLADSRTRGRPFWDGAGVAGLCEDHLVGKLNAATPLGLLASVEFFCRKWLD